MTTPHVVLQVGASKRPVRPGGIVGRLASASLRILDARVSEAHAMVVLRGGGLELLALRGGLWVDGHPEDAVELHAGLEIALAEGILLRVVEVQLPDTTPAAVLDDGRAQVLWADSYSLVRSGQLELVPAFRADALARIWADAVGWMVEIGSSPAVPFTAGRRWEVAGSVLAAVAIPTVRAGTDSTEASLPDALTIVGRHDTAHILRPGREPVLVNGQPARLVTELGLMGATVSWQILASELWPEASDVERQRKPFDRVVQRLRQTLREHGVRDDLVRATGKGTYELFLRPWDEFRDQA